MESVGENHKQSSWWKDLCTIFDVRNQSNWFDDNISWALCDGKQIKLWEDRWIGGQPLKDRFPRLYSLTLSKDKVISEVGQWESTYNVESFHWNLLWRRDLFEWEKDLQQQLLLILNTAQWKRYGLDEWVWRKEEGKGYTVRFGYALRENIDNSITREAFQML